jgi:hypothetical protein
MRDAVGGEAPGSVRLSTSYERFLDDSKLTAQGGIRFERLPNVFVCMDSATMVSQAEERSDCAIRLGRQIAGQEDRHLPRAHQSLGARMRSQFCQSDIEFVGDRPSDLAQ